MKYLIDTCVLSELVKVAPSANVLAWFAVQNPQNLFVSAMTLAELSRGVLQLHKSKRRESLQQWLLQLQEGFEDRVLSFDARVAQVWARMTVQAQARGRSPAAFDSIIAATALAHDCTIVTRNVRDFEALVAPLGSLFDPWGK